MKYEHGYNIYKYDDNNNDNNSNSNEMKWNIYNNNWYNIISVYMNF